MTKIKKQQKLKPLKANEIIKFPCHATLEIDTADSVIFAATLTANGIWNHEGDTIPQVKIALFPRSIPLLIKTLQRAQTTK